uniref:Putative clip-domain serine protease subfamily protein a n=1 Tax=Anopheles marajoara TaxID=58244 RepID=A0A2M4C7C1_9DIPT
MRSVTLTLLEVVTLLGYTTIVLAANQTKERGIIPGDSDAPDPDRCGMRNPDGLAFRMIGREDYDSEYGEFPWMVAILRMEDVLRQTNEKVPHCGGSLIHNQVVLTAAHCINRMLTSELMV